MGAGGGLDDDLPPADPSGIVVVMVGNTAGRGQLRALEDDLEARRAQAGLAGREGQDVAQRRERGPPAVHGQVEVPADRPRELRGVGGLALGVTCGFAWKVGISARSRT